MAIINHLLQEASSLAVATQSMPESLALAASRISREFGSQEDVLEVSIPIELYVRIICFLYISKTIKTAVRLKRNFEKLQSHMLGICLAQMESH